MSVLVQASDLRRFVTEVFAACGLETASAAAAADVVCYADEHGFTTHGTNALFNIYAPRLRDGRISAHAKAEVDRDAGAIAVINGNGGLGLLAMTAATDLAAHKASTHGIGMVAVHGSSHFGSAGFYSQRLSEQGLIGFALTNCGAQGVAPPLGGTVRMLGTNPLSVAVSSGEHEPFVLDMSTTVVATGKIAAAKTRGAELPEGWLYDSDGQAVTDPQRYFDGTADVAWLGGPLTTGGAKGFGLGLLVEILCGPLAGAAFGPTRKVLNGEPLPDTDVGHVAIAIDPAGFRAPEAFAAGIDELLGTVRDCPPTRPGGKVAYPGAPEAARRARSLAHGVELPDAVAADVRALAADVGVAEPKALTTEVPA
ncbi:Ldh family oxidoreductase [Streptomyces sp. NPDC127108]|uniref:Ldh family oxidoreductase n=1 Tax=Streptomyces sp. NPDC127108 TaxID=3345361 RepID=UPI0036458281